MHQGWLLWTLQTLKYQLLISPTQCGCYSSWYNTWCNRLIGLTHLISLLAITQQMYYLYSWIMSCNLEITSETSTFQVLNTKHKHSKVFIHEGNDYFYQNVHQNVSHLVYVEYKQRVPKRLLYTF